MHELMNVEMSRTEFLKLLGVSLVSLLGFGFLMSMAQRMRNNSGQSVADTKATDGFGTRKFGA